MSEDPVVQPGPLGDILERIESLQTEMDILTTHVRSSTDQYEHLSRCIDDLDHRLKLVESKTFSLAVQPSRKNCVNCHKIMANPKDAKCRICGAVQPV